MVDIDDLLLHLSHRIGFIPETVVQRRSGYEAALANTLGMTSATSRYWDAEWRGQRIEFKKGRSIWLDLVRYSEQLLGTAEAAREHVLTLFFVPDASRSRVERILCCDTEALLRKLGLTTEEASALVELRARVPRQLNAQASLTVSDIEAIAKVSIARDP